MGLQVVSCGPRSGSTYSAAVLRGVLPLAHDAELQRAHLSFGALLGMYRDLRFLVYFLVGYPNLGKPKALNSIYPNLPLIYLSKGTRNLGKSP